MNQHHIHFPVALAELWLVSFFFDCIIKLCNGSYRQWWWNCGVVLMMLNRRRFVISAVIYGLYILWIYHEYMVGLPCYRNLSNFTSTSCLFFSASVRINLYALYVSVRADIWYDSNMGVFSPDMTCHTDLLIFLLFFRAINLFLQYCVCRIRIGYARECIIYNIRWMWRWLY